MDRTAFGHFFFWVSQFHGHGLTTLGSCVECSNCHFGEFVTWIRLDELPSKAQTLERLKHFLTNLQAPNKKCGKRLRSKA